MSIVDNFAKFNTEYLNSQNNWFNNLTSFMPVNFGWQMPSLFDWSFMQFPKPNCLNFSDFFANNIWNMSFNQSINYSFNNNFNNGFNNIFSNYTFTMPTIGDTFTPSKKGGSSLQLSFVNKAKSYVNKVNSDKEGNRLFSNGKSQAWCADFVSFNAKETFGNRLPSSFKHFSSVSELRDWGNDNDCYLKVPSSNRADFIAQNVKVGDIMIEKDGGKSHTGIVTKVNSDGSFETVEGNCGNKVAIQTYKPDSKTLSGFISLEKYSA